MTKEEILEMLKAIAAEQARTVSSEMDAKLAALKEVFVKKPEPGEDPFGGFKTFSEYAVAVARAARKSNGSVDSRLKEISKAFGDNVIEEDGWPLPVGYRNQFMEYIIATSNLVSYCTPVPVAVNSVDCPTIDSTSIVAYWVGEGLPFTDTKPETDKVNLKVNKLTGFAIVNSELLEDSPISMEPILSRMFTNKMVHAIERGILLGNGTGQPLGVLDAGATATKTVAKESGQTAATIVEKNLINMYDAQLNKGTAIWVVSNTKVIPQIMQINRAISTAGGVPLFVPPGGLSSAPYGTIFGRPVIFCDSCPALGTKGDINFLDLSYYLLAQKTNGINAESSMHFRFNTDQMSYRWIIRMDGKPGIKYPLTLGNGDEVSPFVSLATRA